MVKKFDLKKNNKDMDQSGIFEWDKLKQNESLKFKMNTRFKSFNSPTVLAYALIAPAAI